MSVIVTSTPSQSEIFSESYSVACSLCSQVLAFQYENSLPKSNIFSRLFCCLFSLLICIYWPFSTTTSQSEILFSKLFFACSLCSYVCIGLSRQLHPPKVKYSLKSCYCSAYWPFKTKTPSQSAIFSEKLLLFCILAFQNIYCSQRPKHPPKVKVDFLKAIHLLVLSAHM